MDEKFEDMFNDLFQGMEACGETSPGVVKSLRVSRHSFRGWELHGPLDQALKTTIQADTVRVVPLHVELHGQPLELELWIDGEHYSMNDVDNPRDLNAAAMAIVQNQALRDKGILDPQELRIKDIAALNIEPIFAPAVLTGPGGTDVPENQLACVVPILLGMDPHSEDED